LEFVVYNLLSILALLACSFPLTAQTSPLMSILDEEMRRNFQALHKADPAPYFISYEVFDSDLEVITASFGAVNAKNHAHNRIADVSVRVGSPKLDNYHRIGRERVQLLHSSPIPLDDNAAAIRRRLWLATDRSYQAAAKRWIQVQTEQKTHVAAEDDSDDFSREEPSVFTESTAALKYIGPDWIERVRKLSTVFEKYPDVLQGNVGLAIEREVKYFTNTEGTKIQHGRVFAQIMMTALGKASDGMDLSTTESFEAEDLANLPKEDVLRGAAEKAAKDLTALMKAQPVDPFTGPAILSGHAAGVFFHEIFGHRIEGHRQKDESEGQTFTKRINQPVLPDFLSVISDPTRTNLAGTFLNGSYAYDDEGVKSRPVTVVDKGILKTFLLSRSPIRGFPNSNGHGRKQAGSEAVSRQSNLIVESTRAVPEAKLREMLRDEIRKQGKPYGLYFSRVTGGYTTTARRGLQAFTVIPLIVYRVYADGRPDELVRGVDIVGTPLQSFEKILATSDRQEVFNGMCGAESGNVPVSAAAPALLISSIEVQSKEKSLDRPPYLPAPEAK
jgi:predicted Zn-dependent protease